MRPNCYTLIRDFGLPTQFTVLAPVHESAVHSYLKSYASHHETLTVFAAEDTNFEEGMAVQEWIEENTNTKQP